jgi:hypothetical protein
MITSPSEFIMGDILSPVNALMEYPSPVFNGIVFGAGYREINSSDAVC